ncbi:MAG: ankyrin repeat domain-containing protein [Campylobacterota bacterium]|nr:ankyrin repeat domain-containing protein [Campylobacterota bacterium]
MSTDRTYLHGKLIEACQNGNVDDVQQWLDAGAEPNFNIQKPINALQIAIQIGNFQIIKLLLEHGAIVKAFVLQQAIEQDRHYFQLLMPNFRACKDETLLLAVLQAAMNIDDFDLAKQAIDQGAKPNSLFLYAIQNFGSTEILALLIENGFDIHVNKNMLLTEWVGSCLIGEWGRKRAQRKDFLAFISDYYLEKPKSIKKFKSWREADKSRLFRMGLSSSNLNMMKFAFLIGVNKNEALNHAFYRYYAKHDECTTNRKVNYKIISYILNSNMEFTNLMISNAVCFNYTELLDSLDRRHDLEYAYELAYKYENDALCQYFSHRGVSYEAQRYVKMKVSAIKGNIKVLREAVNDGAKVEDLDRDVIVEIINANQVASLKFLHDSGLLFDTSLHKYLNSAMNDHKAYESISYLIELGFDIRSVKSMPPEFKIQYPSFAEMKEKRFSNIFDYTMYLVKEVHPNVEGKKKVEILQSIAEFSTLPYVIKKSKEKSREHV